MPFRALFHASARDPPDPPVPVLGIHLARVPWGNRSATWSRYRAPSSHHVLDAAVTACLPIGWYPYECACDAHSVTLFDSPEHFPVLTSIFITIYNPEIDPMDRHSDVFMHNSMLTFISTPFNIIILTPIMIPITRSDQGERISLTINDLAGGRLCQAIGEGHHVLVYDDLRATSKLLIKISKAAYS